MYRIHFDPVIGRFVIQVLVFNLVYVTVKEWVESSNKTEALTFQKFADAVGHIEAIGLDKLYADKSAHKYREHIGSGFRNL